MKKTPIKIVDKIDNEDGTFTLVSDCGDKFITTAKFENQDSGDGYIPNIEIISELKKWRLFRKPLVTKRKEMVPFSVRWERWSYSGDFYLYHSKIIPRHDHEHPKVAILNFLGEAKMTPFFL
ncbi:MAG: hypothetical protein KA007_03065 [Candidatus Pacebacteria bacterium]|nr:hypothetical protein [Candidatus Paceibacterota bacterium]